MTATIYGRGGEASYFLLYTPMQRLLFLCTANRLRSPTAEQVFSQYPTVEAISAGLANDAVETLTPEHFEGVDIIFVMEKAHRNKLGRKLINIAAMAAIFMSLRPKQAF